MKGITVLFFALAAAPVALSPLKLPGIEGPVGFDDLRFSPGLHRVLVPAGRTGRVDLVNPAGGRIEEIAGFSVTRPAGHGHAEGTTSADSGLGLVFASDRTRRTVVIADPSTGRILARARLGGAPDYVRWVAPTREIWVTEPGEEAIETFRLEGGARPSLTRTARFGIPGGPESLEIDPVRRRVYTNTWRGETIAIDVRSRASVGRWKNGCAGSRGLALDERRGLLFVGCEEGGAVALDASDGKAMGRARAGLGVDIIAFGATLSHLYVPGSDSGDLTIIGVRGAGALDVLGTIPTVRGAHCVAADDLGNIYVCDPEHGRLITIRDEFPASR